MKDLVKYIRTQAEMSQEQFADALGTTAITVNRWENDKVAPNTMAQKGLYQFSVEHKINLADFIIDSLKYPNAGKDIIYHGSRTGIVGEIAPISRDKCDFGKGFYTGTHPFQPLTLVCDEKKPIFYTLRMNLDGVKVLHVDMGIEWALLIAYYRGYMDGVKGTPIYEKYAHLADGYDVIVGLIANDRMYHTLTDFFNGTVTDTVMIKSLSALELGTQYVPITSHGCKAFEILEEHPLKPLELMALKDKSILNREEGVALANQMRETYRREGKYFDEILKGV